MKKKNIIGLSLLICSLIFYGCGKEKEEEKEVERVPDKLVINTEEDEKEVEADTEQNIVPPLFSDMEELRVQIETIVSQENALGNTMAVYIEDLNSEGVISISEQRMQAASLIKLYIAGCVYENLEKMMVHDTYAGDTQNLIYMMLSASDNNAANELVRRLGNGDAAAGRGVINSYCEQNGYTSSHMGRLLLESNALDDNYTSPADCAKFIKEVYNGSIPGAADILEYMKQQQRTHKIPSGIPADVIVANKTGELADVENDAAIIITDQGAYILCVMMENLSAPGAAQGTIVNVSSIVYQSLL
ncbi:MAG: serine hydrolase [Schaedlerella sp.]|nr:serine hydrolase [Schaedlerella sp.]